jgi:hypothetical protein
MSNCLFVKCRYDHYWIRSDELPSIFDETYESDGILCPFCKGDSSSIRHIPHNVILDEIIYRIDGSITADQLIIMLILEHNLRISDLYLRKSIEHLGGI